MEKAFVKGNKAKFLQLSTIIYQLNFKIESFLNHSENNSGFKHNFCLNHLVWRDLVNYSKFIKGRFILLLYD